MPNHCSNRIIVRGPKEDMVFLKKLFEEAQSKHEASEEVELCDLNWFYPMPSELKGIRWGGCTIDGKHYSVWRVDNAGKPTPIAEEELERLRKEYDGADSWYSWAIQNWGTKWGVYDTRDAYFKEEDDGTSEYSVVCESAWGPPENCFHNALHEHPTLSFELHFAEQGVGFAGSTEISSDGISSHTFDGPFYLDRPDDMDEDEYWDRIEEFLTSPVQNLVEQHGIGLGG